ncbi:FAD dependent oxidoreductase [Thelonectria olida]|uniref:FAD dependent oxidoreductase n=1 Tax=Thelonectria olida TaxID=1576542 RepID=A0A9P8W470_9HYPO|nr:FAD dependent oxidoreductase [Thelonectria olida]
MGSPNVSLRKDSSILIIGAGTFGISTAYHLVQRGYSDITCIDRHPWPSVDSAGHDLNKIVRTEYDESMYTELALQALDVWRKPEWNGIFHETGRLSTTSGDALAEQHLRESFANLQKAGQGDKVKLVQGRDQIVSHVPQLQNAPDLEKWNGLFNSIGGWVHSRKALEKWAAEAERLGAKFISGSRGTMTGLQVNSEGELLGIRVASGDVLCADQYILSTGAASPQVVPELSQQLWSKCWTLAHIELTEEEIIQWKGVPVIDHFELGFMFEPDPETHRIKICDNNPGYQYQMGTFTDDSTKTATRYSIPRYASAHPRDGIPAEAKAAINRFIDAIMPQFSGRPLVDAKVCWCTDSPDGHWLIDRHPQHKSLLLATGDSGHAFKMFPIIGGYIADALEGRPGGLRKEWRYGGRDAKVVSTRPTSQVKDLRDVLTLQAKM